MSSKGGRQQMTAPNPNQKIPQHYIPPRYGEIDIEDVNLIAADSLKQSILANKTLERHALVTKELIETKAKLERVEKESAQRLKRIEQLKAEIKKLTDNRTNGYEKMDYIEVANGVRE